MTGFAYLCECDTRDCRETVWMTHAEFVAAAKKGRIVAPNHTQADPVVGKGVGYRIVAGLVAA